MSIDNAQKPTLTSEDDKPDEWDQRIIDTGCDKENSSLTDCYYEKKDWRKCVDEMMILKKCWNDNNNNARVHTEDVQTSE